MLPHCICGITAQNRVPYLNFKLLEAVPIPQLSLEAFSTSLCNSWADDMIHDKAYGLLFMLIIHVDAITWTCIVCKRLSHASQV